MLPGYGGEQAQSQPITSSSASVYRLPTDPVKARAPMPAFNYGGSCWQPGEQAPVNVHGESVHGTVSACTTQAFSAIVSRDSVPEDVDWEAETSAAYLRYDGDATQLFDPEA